MEIEKKLNDIYSNSQKLFVITFKKNYPNSEFLLKLLEHINIFNPVFFIKKATDLQLMEILEKLDFINNYKSIIPFFYIELNGTELKNFNDWVKRKNYFDYMRFFPVILIEDTISLEDILNLIKIYNIYNVSFDLSRLTYLEIYNMLDILQNSSIKENCIIFINKNNDQSFLKNLTKYSIPIYFIPE
ncbi:MAG: hypothetical protein ACTSWR_03655 [Candidatus Helarchaeota archaeon]